MGTAGRILLSSAIVLLAAMGCLALFGLMGVGFASGSIGPIVIVPAMVIGLLLGVPGSWTLGLFAVHDGFPVLTPLGVVVVYLVPALMLFLKMRGRGRRRA